MIFLRRLAGRVGRWLIQFEPKPPAKIYTVKLDGKVTQVTLDDLKRGYRKRTERDNERTVG